MPSAETFIAQRKASRAALNRVLRYPGNLGEFQTTLEFNKYSYTSTGGAVPGEGSGSIILPLPKVISDTLSINVGSNELGVIGNLSAQAGAPGADPNKIAATLSNLKTQFEAGAKNAGTAVGDALQGDFSGVFKGLSNGASVAGYLVKSGLASIAPDITNGFGVGTGTAVNPFATLVFSGVNLKTHTLEWTLAPETVSDSDYIKEIINVIRQNIVPEYGQVTGSSTGISALDRGLLKYPSFVTVKFSGINQEYYMKFKPAMVQSFTTDFTPNGLAVLRGGKPAIINISMTIQEAQIWTAEDYGGGSGTGDNSANGAGETNESQLTESGEPGSDSRAGSTDRVGVTPSGNVTLGPTGFVPPAI